MISDRMRDRAKFNTAVDPYRLLAEGAYMIDALSTALASLVKHTGELEARNSDYHAQSETEPVRSMPLGNAIFVLAALNVGATGKNEQIEALRFYASGKHCHGDIIIDRGERAANALAHLA